ncbi:hypothetical protein JCM19236_2251 [Vibrio sp. JCM 19236]|nr:hypothetical protein JCM19236_2251 [Vibrio sp. JCM 19236]
MNDAVQHQTEITEGEQFELQAKFKFEVSAEKLIYDLKCRSLAR